MKTIAVSSTKGGVGKSTVSWGIATALAHKGYRVGMIGADLEGDALGYMAGLNFEKLAGDGLIKPIEVAGVKMISLSLFIEPEWLDSPIMLHEERKNEIIRQMLQAVDWGKIDLMIVDSPPSTGEELRAITKLLVPDAFIMVTLPQKLAELPVRRMIRAVRDEFHIPILGIVENNLNNVTGNAGEELSKITEIPLLAKIQWDKNIPEAMDKGEAVDHTQFEGLADIIEKTYLKPKSVKKKAAKGKGKNNKSKVKKQQSGHNKTRKKE